MFAQLPSYDHLMRSTRRHFFGTSALGLGALAMRGIVGEAHAAPLPQGTHEVALVEPAGETVLAGQTVGWAALAAANVPGGVM